MNSELARNATLLSARIGIGIVFIAHGWQKLATRGLSATADSFAGMGIPLPTVSAYVTAFLEIGGGALVISGLLTSLMSALLAATAVGALVFAHAEDGLLGGYEFVLTLALLCLVPAVFGPGKFALSALIGRTGNVRGRPEAAKTPTVRGDGA